MDVDSEAEEMIDLSDYGSNKKRKRKRDDGDDFRITEFGLYDKLMNMFNIIAFVFVF